jgi:hypothetical protein
MDAAGRQYLVVVAKAEFVVGRSVVIPADVQPTLVEADSFEGDPASSAPVEESDFAPFKPYCDVLLNGGGVCA